MTEIYDDSDLLYPRPPAKQRRQFRPTRERVFSVVSPAALIIFWELFARIGVLDERVFSTPSAVIVRIVELIGDGSLLQDAGITLQRFAIGTALGVIPGLFLGLTMGLFRTARAIINPLISAVYPLPRIALFPLVLLVMGLNERSIAVMVALGCFFTVIITTSAGVLNVDPIYLKVARSFNVRTVDIYRRVVFPAALPIIFGGLRIAIGLSLLSVVAVEFLVANNGLGYMIWHSWQLLSLRDSMVGLVMTGLLGYGLFTLLSAIERRAVPYRSSTGART